MCQNGELWNYQENEEIATSRSFGTRNDSLITCETLFTLGNIIFDFIILLKPACGQEFHKGPASKLRGLDSRQKIVRMADPLFADGNDKSVS